MKHLLALVALLSSTSFAATVRHLPPTAREVLKAKEDAQAASPEKLKYAGAIVAAAVEASVDSRLGERLRFDSNALVTRENEIDEKLRTVVTKFMNEKYVCTSVAISRLKTVVPPGHFAIFHQNDVIDDTIREVNNWDIADVKVSCVDAHSGAPVDKFQIKDLAITGADRGVFHVDDQEFTPTWNGRQIAAYAHEQTPGLLVRAGREVVREFHHDIYLAKKAL